MFDRTPLRDRSSPSSHQAPRPLMQQWRPTQLGDIQSLPQCRRSASRVLSGMVLTGSDLLHEFEVERLTRRIGRKHALHAELLG